jgi:hypothetical protein
VEPRHPVDLAALAQQPEALVDAEQERSGPDRDDDVPGRLAELLEQLRRERADAGDEERRPAVARVEGAGPGREGVGCRRDRGPVALDRTTSAP